MNEPTTATFRAYDHLSGGVAAHPEEADGLREQLQQLESRIAALRDLHKRTGAASAAVRPWCAHCGFGTDWPCSTVRVLDGVQAQGEQQ